MRKLRGFVIDRRSGRFVEGVLVTVRVTVRDTEYPVAALASDSSGYVSFNIPDTPDGAALSIHAGSLSTMPSPQSDARAATPDFVLEVDETVPNGPSRAPSIQEPDDLDWQLSPSSFVAGEEIRVGEGDCEVPRRNHDVLQTSRFLRIKRIPLEVNGEEPNGGRVRAFLNWLLDRRPQPAESNTATTTSIDLLKPPAADRSPVFCEVTEFEQAWRDLGHCLGSLAYSMPLAPCESTKIAIIESTRSDTLSRQDDIFAEESLIHQLTHARSIDESIHAAAAVNQRTFAAIGGGRATLGLGPLSLSIGGGLQEERAGRSSDVTGG